MATAEVVPCWGRYKVRVSGRLLSESFPTVDAAFDFLADYLCGSAY